MAYTTTPEQSTYKTERYSLVGEMKQIDGRDLTQQRTVNMMPELNYTTVTQEKTFYLRKRPGVKMFSQFVPGEGRGVYNWQDKLFTVIGNAVHANNTYLFTLPTITGRVGWAAYFGQVYGQALILVDGISGWVIKPDLTFTQIASSGFPIPHVPDPIVIDEYLILSKAGGGDFYQSALDNPTVWTAGDFNTAEMFPDETVAMTKFKNYIVVGGKNSIEFFYDSGNPSGSTFQRQEAVVQQIGVLVPNTLRTTEEDIFFVGETGQGGKSVWMIEKFKSTDIGTVQLRQAIDAEGPAVSKATAFVVRTCGHQFYILSLSSRTFVYDTDLKMWHEWAYGDGVFDFRYSSYNNSNNPVILHTSNGAVYELEQFNYTDDGLPIICTIQTDCVDFKSYNRKSFNRLTVPADLDDGADVYLDVFWSDDSFGTIKGPRQIKLNADLPAIYKMGMSRKRYFRFVYTGPRPLRLEFFELDVNILMH